MTAVFLGTPAEAVPILAGLLEATPVVAVITRPDAARGRSGQPVPPPVKVAAQAWGLRVVQPRDTAELEDMLRAMDFDIAVVAAFGRLISEEALGMPRLGFVNVHFSLLPRWRGASPVVRALLAGDDTTGVSLMQMDAGLDTGPVLAASEVEMRADDTAGTLTARLAAAGARLLTDSFPLLQAGELEPRPQDDSLATAAGKVKTDEAHVDPLRHTVAAVRRAVRAFNPKPGAWSVFDGERLKLWRAEAGEGDVPPGEIVFAGERVLLGVRDGVVTLVEVQPAGKASMSAQAWMHGRRGLPAHYEVR